VDVVIEAPTAFGKTSSEKLLGEKELILTWMTKVVTSDKTKMRVSRLAGSKTWWTQAISLARRPRRT
jgi:hypothetical protein